MSDDTVALIPYDGPEALTPDAILTGAVRLHGGHDPDEARRRAREAAMAWENLPYHTAVAVGAFVEAMQPVMAVVKQAVEAFSAIASTPEFRRLALELGVDMGDSSHKPTRYERHMARVAASPRARKRRHR